MNTFTEKRTPRSEKKQKTREALLESARALFVERGFERTTIRDVAERAGVAVGTVFVHFPDKTALLAATLDDQLELTLTRAWSTLPAGPPRAQLRHVVSALYRMYGRSPVLARVLIKESLFLEGPSQSASAARLGEFMQWLTTSLSRPGELRAGLDSKVAARAVFAAYLACLIEALASPRLDVKRATERFDGLIEPWFARKRGET